MIEKGTMAKHVEKKTPASIQGHFSAICSPLDSYTREQIPLLAWSSADLRIGIELA
jgi:hypothetical protein